MKCLLLEDNPAIGHRLVSFLSRYNIDCTLTTTSDSFLAKLKNDDSNFSVILLDYNIHGSVLAMEDIIKHIRSIKSLSLVPILCYSAHFDVATTVLNAGADDMMLLRRQKNNIQLIENNNYIFGLDDANMELTSVGAPVIMEKPVNKKHMIELVARIRALARRTFGNASNEIQIKYLNYNLATRAFSINNISINFSVKEKAVLECLIEHSGGTCSRKICMQRLYAQGELTESATIPNAKIIDVFMCRIKQKIKAAYALAFPNKTFSQAGQIIETVWGMGYKIVGNKKFVPPKVVDPVNPSDAQESLITTRRLVESKDLKINSKIDGNITSIGW
jgi:DNA-binding response OmpR family regulator